MKKIAKASLIVLVCSSFFVGCSSRSSASPNSCQKGMYCYKNINFGKSRGYSYEKGIRDGCKTANGFFRKDYALSNRNKEYFDGWILGRSKCRQQLPNEGIRLAEQKSKQRAEYQIREMKLEQELQPQQEDIVDAILNENSDQAQDLEY